MLQACEPAFSSGSCAPINAWVGGIAPLVNVTAYPSVSLSLSLFSLSRLFSTSLRCCVYEPLRQSEDRGVATVSGGQIVVGGEVLSDGQQYAFDYISDVVKFANPDGSSVFITFSVEIEQ